MADFVLTDGTEVNFEMDNITIGEYRSLVGGKLTQAQDDEIVSRVSGIPIEKINTLKFTEYRKFMRAFFNKAREPLDPND